MTENRSFRARVIEPVANDKAGLAVEFEFHERVPGLDHDTIVIDLRDDAAMSDAEALVRALNAHGARVRIN